MSNRTSMELKLNLTGTPHNGGSRWLLLSMSNRTSMELKRWLLGNAVGVVQFFALLSLNV